MKHSYKVCILSAGVGARMAGFTESLNKSMLPLNYKPVISHIIEEFEPTVPLVVVVGYRKDTLMQYLRTAYPERDIEFVEVDKYTGPHTGPGYSLLSAKDKLQCPFIVSAADTIVLDKPVPPNYNWVGVAPVEDTTRFCSFNIKDGAVVEIYDKVKTSNKYAFIGLAGIKDYAEFWHSLETNKTIIGGEVQLSNGLEGLLEKTLVAEKFNWYDTGTPESYQQTCQAFKSDFKNLDKKGEQIYFVGDKVVKYFENADIAKKRVERSRILAGVVPEVIAHSDNFYVYRKVPGNTLSAELTQDKFTHYLDWLSRNLWKDVPLGPEKQSEFSKACMDFYKEKTLKRLDAFYEKTKMHDAEMTINGVRTPALHEMLARVDWNSLSHGVPSRIHGDLVFDNVVVAQNGSAGANGNGHSFTLLDWRQEFAGLLEYGDLYYDLGKTYHALTITHDGIYKDLYSVSREGSDIHVDFYTNFRTNSCKPIFEKFIASKGYSLNKVRLISAIIHLNMSPLHHSPFDELLYYLGRLELYQCIYQKL